MSSQGASRLPPKFVLVYTKDLRKKHKNWVDGFGRLFSNGKLCLYSSEDRLIDSQFIPRDALDSDEPIKLDFHLAEVDTPLQFAGPSTNSLLKPAPAAGSICRPLKRLPNPKNLTHDSPTPPRRAALDKVRSANEVLSLFSAVGNSDSNSSSLKFPKKKRRLGTHQPSISPVGSSIRLLLPLKRTSFKPPRQISPPSTPTDGINEPCSGCPTLNPALEGPQDDSPTLKTPTEIEIDGFGFPGPLKFSEKPVQSDFPKIPDSFGSLTTYSDCFSNAVVAELQGQVDKLSSRYFSFRKKLMDGSLSEPRFIQETFRRHRIQFYHKEWLELQIINDEDDSDGRFSRKRGPNSSWRQKSVSTINPQSCKIWLKLTGNISESKEKSSSYAKDDIWVLSSDSGFPDARPHWTGFFRSKFYGFSSRNMMLLSPLVPNTLPIPGELAVGKYRASFRVFGIRAIPNATELGLLDTLKNLPLSPIPLTPILLNGKIEQQDNLTSLTRSKKKGSQLQFPKLKAPIKLLESLRESHLKDWSLNSDQVHVLDSCLKWFNRDFLPVNHDSSWKGPSHTPDMSPVVLVHGSFGAGKTFLLTSIAICLSRVLDAIDPTKRIRILVSSLSNVAVDNVLLSLLERRFFDFRRVGSAKRIAKPILDFTVHHRNEIAMMGNDPRLGVSQGVTYQTGPQSTASSRKVTHSSLPRIVGTTCASSISEALDRDRFPIVLLDECSQMIEPLSLQTVSRFNVERLLCVGDPLQLLPTLPGHDNWTSSSKMSSPSDKLSGLFKTVFVRLSRLGLQPIFLHTQYRCHPSISQLTSDMFYDGKLKDGVDSADRAPLLVRVAASGGAEAELPPLVFCDISDGQEMTMPGFGESLYNETEARLTATIVFAFLERGVPAQSIGVIALYRAQANRVRQILEQRWSQSQPGSSGSCNPEAGAEGGGATAVAVSTVDAFQGAEKDIIILTCCRTRSWDFVDNPHRMNVALTRGRHHLLVLGNARALSGSPRWNQVIGYSRRIPRSFHPNPRKLLSFLEACTRSLNSRTDDHIQMLDKPSQGSCDVGNAENNDV